LNFEHPGEDDQEILHRLRACLPILADLARGDVFLFTATDNPTKLAVDACATPRTVPSIGIGLAKGDFVRNEDEPSIARALTRGAFSHNTPRLRGQGHPTVQDVYPIRNGQTVVAALAVEVGLVESERWQRKSIVYRRAIERLRRLVVDGRLSGASGLSRLSEHDGPMVVTGGGEIVYISSLAEQLYRRVGYTYSLLHNNLGKLRTDESVFSSAIETGQCTEQVVQEGPYTWLKRAIPLLGEEGERIWNRVLNRFEPGNSVILTVHDVTDDVQKERELKIKSAMIQEIHHRVKNNLQTIAALLRLQARRTGSAEVGDILKESINRILSIAVVHEFLAHQESNEVDMRAIAQQIIAEVTRSILDPEKRIHFSLEADPVTLPTQQATSFALVINELLHNTVEHAFSAALEGQVVVRIAQNDGRVVLEVVDDGEGLPPTFDLRTSGSLGLQIVQTLVREDLKGTFQLVRAGDRGAKGIVSFPRVGLG
jgi:two-component sensor histidine kinase